MNIPTCDNCPFYLWHYCGFLKEKITVDDEDMIQKAGCLSHPRAKEYLMDEHQDRTPITHTHNIHKLDIVYKDEMV